MTEQITKAVPQLGELKGAGRLFFGPFAEKGHQIDAWADVIEGMADKAQAVLDTFDERVQDAQIPGLDLQDETISGSGFRAERRNYRIVQRGPGLMAVYVARWGKDLYVSWRLFAGRLSLAKFRNWLIVCGAIGLLPGLCYLCGGLGGAGFARDVGEKLASFCLGLLGLLIVIASSAVFLSLIALVLGWLVARDPLLFWRERLDEFGQDEVAALSIDVHKKLLAAIDVVGIDTTLLLTKEDFALSGRRSRLI